MPIELMVLDMAGTTIEEYGAVYDALAEAVTAAGGKPSEADIQRWMGAGKREAIQHLLEEHFGHEVAPETVDAAFADFRSRLDKAYRDRPPVPLPGVPEALGRIRAAGTKVALTTGFDREVTESILHTLGWEHDVVDAVVCVDDVPAGRPAPYMIFRAMEATGVHDVARVLVAGDTIRDLQAGTNAGAGFVVGVLTGKLDATGLGAERHTHLLPGVADLPTLLTP
ncbi:phosphonatase-like hydrolase [Planotetraspora kaengkrachanensis]|uniref:Phosphonoacetaldehyde hydrolase n=1 Tax=Planotetraspora kaengkrachanensis TaxID=575193 RepID=A0A8J3M2Y8_9ACTN|nr:phosphonatase-like hydrolase [Planotetraspora kaengkrachanensis]GIG78399.1 phosphonoacetaldehyde hydrolase [Planotetraspora kaengkrachanensis]